MPATKPLLQLLFYSILFSIGMYGLHTLEQHYFVIQFSGYQQNFMLQLLTAKQRSDIIDRLLTVSCEGKRAITMYIGSSALVAYILLLLLHSFYKWLIPSKTSWLWYLHTLSSIGFIICFGIIYYYLFTWVMYMEWNGDFAYYYWATRLFAFNLLVLFSLPIIAKLIPSKNLHS